jgi:hypothetical protein
VGEIGDRIREVDAVANAIATAMEEQGAATQEIARNVAQTADASREVAQKIQRVSQQADAVGTSAADVRTAVLSVTENIQGLRETLVRVVRTSTTDADRRSHPRYRIDAKFEATNAAGQRIQAKLADASERGACLETSQAMKLGERGTLRFDGVGAALQFFVRDVEPARLHVEFEKPDPAYRDWFQRRIAGLQPI